MFKAEYTPYGQTLGRPSTSYLNQYIVNDNVRAIKLRSWFIGAAKTYKCDLVNIIEVELYQPWGLVVQSHGDLTILYTSEESRKGRDQTILQSSSGVQADHIKRGKAPD